MYWMLSLFQCRWCYHFLWCKCYPFWSLGCYHFRVLRMLSFYGLNVIIFCQGCFHFSELENVFIFLVLICYHLCYHLCYHFLHKLSFFELPAWCYHFIIIWCYHFSQSAKCYHFYVIIFLSTSWVLSFMLSFDVIIYCYHFPLFSFSWKRDTL